jgi:3-oxoacyl-(acyl-carrier-protein) synthase
MSRVVKMGVASAMKALKEAEVTVPDAIITGTGLGCLEDTVSFLRKLSVSEEALNPTPFIQSTHNTIGSQIALLLNCRNYNQTYSHRAHSWESALLDAIMMLQQYPNLNILAGAADEIVNESHDVQNHFHLFRQKINSSLALFESKERGTLHGEGAAYFLLSGKPGALPYACIEEVTTMYKPTEEALKQFVETILQKQNLTTNNIDFVLSGKSGDQKSDAILDRISFDLFQGKVGRFKHLCGEYSTASAFSVWLLARILYNQSVPEIIFPAFNRSKIKYGLILNQYFGTYYSIILMKSCRDL